jgi:hypothetical protein
MAFFQNAMQVFANIFCNRTNFVRSFTDVIRSFGLEHICSRMVQTDVRMEHPVHPMEHPVHPMEHPVHPMEHPVHPMEHYYPPRNMRAVRVGILIERKFLYYLNNY